MWIEIQVRKDGPGPNWEAMGVKPKKGQTEYHYVRKLIWSQNILTFEETGDGELQITLLDGELLFAKNEFDYLKDLLNSDIEDEDEPTEEDMVL